jgi:hypothetical protein
LAVIGKPNHALGVLPSDTFNLPFPSQFLSFVGASGGVTLGTVTVDTVGGEIGVAITLPAGLWPICARKIYATGTTATDIVEFWST